MRAGLFQILPGVRVAVSNPPRCERGCFRASQVREWLFQGLPGASIVTSLLCQASPSLTFFSPGDFLGGLALAASELQGPRLGYSGAQRRGGYCAHPGRSGWDGHLSSPSFPDVS